MTQDRTEPRIRLTGEVDFTMMYVAHDAFGRDLRRIATACARGEARAPEVRASWLLFTEQLHVHHQAEDVALWPALREAVQTPNEIDVLDAMAEEHAQIDPGLEAVDQALISGHDDPATAVTSLAAGLTAHMQHEETAALPLVETYLGRTGWATFGRHVRDRQGLRAAPRLLPWLLDGASATDQSTVLAMLPAPARLLYRNIWMPRYRRSTRLRD